MNIRLFIAIAVSTAITFTLRALPFIIFNGRRRLPDMLMRLGRILPAAIMAVLIVYCLRDSFYAPFAMGIPGIGGVLVTGVTYKWKHNTMLSIALGTAAYMMILRFL